jgi:hypothetical protein
MTREDLIRGAGETAPELMQKTASILSALERLAPDRAEEVAAEMAAITDYTYEKVAVGPMGVWMAAAGSAAVSGVFNSMAGDLYDAAKKGLTRQRNFNTIMKANPDLKVHPKDRLQASFNAMHTYAPELTADPLVGGSLLKNMVEGPMGNEAMVIKDMIQSRKNIMDAKDKQFRPGVPIELPTDMDQRRESRDVATDRFRRKQDKDEQAYRVKVDAQRRADKARESRLREAGDRGKDQRQVASTLLRSKVDDWKKGQPKGSRGAPSGAEMGAMWKDSLRQAKGMK